MIAGAQRDCGDLDRGRGKLVTAFWSSMHELSVLGRENPQSGWGRRKLSVVSVSDCTWVGGAITQRC
jgi:hypothetical protein